LNFTERLAKEKVMNLFNCYQLLGLYTAAPLAIQWLASNGNTAWAVVLGVLELLGFIFLGIALNAVTE
jgi:hypothetical protein